MRKRKILLFLFVILLFMFVKSEAKAEEKKPSLKIITDWSKYNPHIKKDKSIYKRLSNNYISKYVPGSSNGCIFPFVESLNSENSKHGYSDYIRSRYGLVDETGMIVCDDIYKDFRYCDGFWLMMKNDGKLDKISVDGKSSEPIDFYIINFNVFGNHEITDLGEEYDEDFHIYTYEDKIYIYLSDTYVDYNNDKNNHANPIIEMVYSKDGELISKRDIPFDTSLCGELIPRFDSCCLYMINNVEIGNSITISVTDDRNDMRLKNYKLDINTGETLVEYGFELPTYCENGTYIKEYNYENSTILNCDFKVILQDTFTNIAYIGNDLYVCSSNEDSCLHLLKLKDSKFEYLLEEYNKVCFADNYFLVKDKDSFKLIDIFGNQYVGGEKEGIDALLRIMIDKLKTEEKYDNQYVKYYDSIYSSCTAYNNPELELPGILRNDNYPFKYNYENSVYKDTYVNVTPYTYLMTIWLTDACFESNNRIFHYNRMIDSSSEEIIFDYYPKVYFADLD